MEEPERIENDMKHVFCVFPKKRVKTNLKNV